MPILKLFLSLFSFILFVFTNRKRLLHALYIQFLTIQVLTRAATQHGYHITFQPHEKHAIAALYKETPRARRFFSLVSPRTVLTAWNNFLARHWSFKKKAPGRPPITAALKQLILKLKQENFLWGARRIRDELSKLSITVSHETISRILQHFRKTGGILPTLTWKQFISSHWKTIFSCDVLTVTAFSMVTFYVFFIIKLETRKIVRINVTTNPTIQFLRNQFSVFDEEYPNSYLIHDNSGELKWFPYDQYTIKDVRTVPYSPNMNAYAERFVRSIRNECLDYFVIFTQGQLRRIVNSYIDYYNKYRPHQGLKGIPDGPPEQGSKTGAIKQKSLLFGLHNHYYREAA